MEVERDPESVSENRTTTDRPTVAQLAEDADDTLFSSVVHSSNHLLHVFYPNILTIHITLDQGPTVSHSLPSMMIVILLTECFLDMPTRYRMCMTVELTIFYSLNCCIRIIL